MKYLWIVVLIIAYAIWFYATVENVYNEMKRGIFRFPYCLTVLKWYSNAFVLAHLLSLFLYSVWLYFK